MATISGTTAEKIFSLTAFKGLNENPDGDTKLKMGEAAAVRNFRVTRDGNLQRRPGTRTIVTLSAGNPVKGLWTGFVNGHEYMLGACNGKLYRLWDDVSGDFAVAEIGTVSTDKDVYIFGFSGIAYILDGNSYKQWDGETLADVTGYRPLVMIAIPPDGGGELLENVNRLNGQRRAWLSPDGTGKTFQLPDTTSEITSIDYIKKTTNGETIDPSTYSYNLSAGTITFNTAPERTTNSLEVGWTVRQDLRSQVTAMQYAKPVHLFRHRFQRAAESGLLPGFV